MDREGTGIRGPLGKRIQSSSRSHRETVWLDVGFCLSFPRAKATRGMGWRLGPQEAASWGFLREISYEASSILSVTVMCAWQRPVTFPSIPWVCAGQVGQGLKMARSHWCSIGPLRAITLAQLVPGGAWACGEVTVTARALAIGTGWTGLDNGFPVPVW